MGKFWDTLTPKHEAFIQAQPLFFVATAPLDASGHINLSPKGLDTFRIHAPTQVSYLDLTGSGNETAAHLMENGRITLMFCAFEGAPNILRIYGTGRTILPDDPAWEQWSASYPSFPGIRQIMVIEVTKVQTSCGFAVPLMSFEAHRDTLLNWVNKMGDERLPAYREEKNSYSIDGLPTPLAPAEGTVT